MRLLFQLLIPALIVVALAVMIWRRRSGPGPSSGPEQPMSTAAFIAVITIGSALAAALVLGTQG